MSAWAWCMWAAVLAGVGAFVFLACLVWSIWRESRGRGR
jgi:hypothetical protein